MNIFKTALISILVLLNISCRHTNEALMAKMKEFNAGRDLELEIKLDKGQYRIEEPITVQYTFKNTGGSVIHLREILFLDLSFAIKNKETSEKGMLPIRTLPNDVNRAGNITTIEPGKTLSEERVIRKTLYVMPNKPGHYEMCIAYWNAAEKSGKTNLWVGKVKSNTVNFEIIE